MPGTTSLVRRSIVGPFSQISLHFHHFVCAEHEHAAEHRRAVTVSSTNYPPRAVRCVRQADTILQIIDRTVS